MMLLMVLPKVSRSGKVDIKVFFHSLLISQSRLMHRLSWIGVCCLFMQASDASCDLLLSTSTGWVGFRVMYVSTGCALSIVCVWE